jgi:uncharacterized protein YndB with AHSA1/START domain
MALFRKLVLHATPAQVWDAVATGPGWTSWYHPSELEPSRGGIARTDFGGGTFVEGEVRVYEPGKRIVLSTLRVAHDIGAEPEEDEATMEFSLAEPEDDLHAVPIEPGGSLSVLRSRLGEPQPMARGVGETLGTRRSRGKQTILYFRQRGFPEVDQAVYEAGWDVYFHTLSEYLIHFAGKPPLTHSSIAAPAIEKQQQFARLTAGLGIDRDVKVGDEIETKPKGRDDTIKGIVDLKMSDPNLEAVGVRLPDGFLRAMSDETCGSALLFYQYVVDPPPDFAAVRESLIAKTRETAASWQGWLQEQMAA